MIFLIGDTETAGLGDEKRACEIALRLIDEDMNTIQEWQSLVDPQIKINPDAMAIHGITDEDVKFAPTSNEFVEHVLGKKFEGDICLIGHNCLTGDHEVLTEVGWQRLDSLEGAVRAMQWSSVDNKLSFCDCVVVGKLYTGSLYEWDTQFHRGVYTEDHRMYFKTSGKLSAGWQVSTPLELSSKAPNSLHIPVSGVYAPESVIDVSPDEARVLEMLRADANIEVSMQVRLNLKKQRKIDRCQALLAQVGIPYKLSVRADGATRISLSRCPVLDKLTGLLGTAKDKAYGQWVLKLSVPARLAILNELHHWDGHYTGDDKVLKQATRLSSYKQEELDWLATLASITQQSGVVYSMKPNTRGFSRPDSLLGSVTIRPRTTVKTLEKPSVTQVEYLPVYCLTTETGAFLVRRQGVTWVTGNCQFDKPMLDIVGNITNTICTLDMARTYVKGPENYKLQTLREFFHIPEDAAHRAMGDVNVTHQLLRIFVEMSGRPLAQHALVEDRVIHTMPFGKHAGKPLFSLPYSYVSWLLGLPDLDKNLRTSLIAIKELKSDH